MKSFAKRLSAGIAVLMVVALSLPVFAVNSHASDANRTVRVGFFAYPGYHEMENGVKSGLGYDFLMMLQRYTNLNYEFVGYDKSWEDMQEMLQAGEIDLVTSARKTLEREEIYDFSEPIGTNSAQINVRKNDKRFVRGDFEALNNKTIGVITGNSRNSDLAAFAEEKGFTYKVLEYESAEELQEALQTKKVDAIATSSLRKAQNEETIAEFAPQDFYCIVRKGDSELLNEINYGISQMDMNEGNWKDDLYYKNYGDGNTGELIFTQRELDYIAAVQRGDIVITATAQPDSTPYSFKEMGSLTGIIPDYFAHLMNMAGLKYTTVAAKDRVEFHDWLENNHTDIVMDFRFTGSPQTDIKDFGLLTDPYMVMTTSRVTRKGYSGKYHRIAYVDSWVTSSVEDDFADDARFIKYETREAAMKAVSSGEADVCYVYTYTAERFINTDPETNLQSGILKNPTCNAYFYISPDADHELCSILNKCIKVENSSQLDEYIKKYTTVTYESLGLFSYLKLHPVYIYLAMGLVLFCVILIFITAGRSRTARMKTEQLKREQAQQKLLEEALTFTNFFLDTYISAYFVNLDTLECQVYKRTAQLEQEFPIVGDYVQSLTEYIDTCVHPDDREGMLMVTRPWKMKELIAQAPEYIHVFRDISGGVEKMYKMQVIRGTVEGQAAFGFVDITEEYQEQQKHFLGAVQLSPDILGKANIGLWAFELDEGKAPRMYVDDTMLGLVGLDHQVSPEETYHAWYDHIDEGSYDLVTDAVAKMMAGEHAEVQYPWHHPNGDTMIVRCGGVRNDEYTGGIRIEGTHQNVTAVLHYDEEEKRKEKESLALKLISALSEAYSSLYYVTAETGEYQLITRDDEYGNKVNDRLVHESNFYQDTRDSIAKVIYDEDYEKIKPFCSWENMERSFGDNDSFSVDYRLVIEGEPIWYRVKTVKIPGADNETVYAIGVMSIQEELQRREKEARDAAVLAGLSDDFGCVIYVDFKTGEEIHYRFDPLLTEKVPGWEDFTNFDLRMKTLVDTLVVAEDRPYFENAAEVKDKILEIVHREGVYYRNFRVLIDGEITYYQLKIVKGENSDDHIIAGLRNIDETAKKELEYQEKLEAANKSKTDFLFNMSHDIRTPMNAIIGFTELAKKHIDDRDRVVDSLDKIELSGNHLLELINEVLDMSRVEAGKLHSEMKVVDVSEEAKRLVTICRESAGQRNITLTYEEKNIVHPNVIADELHINQIIMNVLGNAIKYTLPGGKVHYTAEELESDIEGHGVYVFTVEDTGIGMSPEFLEHVYDSFAREENASTSKIQGTGLGMAIVKRLVDYMNGDIRIESEQGKGTKVTITFHLKLAQVDESKHDSDENREVILEGKKVLLVEDNDLNREIATDLLSDHGMIVDAAIDGFDAVEHVMANGAHYYDFVLMDIQMPIMDGHETTSRIRQLPDTEDLPIIALSANAFEEDKRRSIEAGMNDHVSKPIAIPKLITALSRFVK